MSIKKSTFITTLVLLVLVLVLGACGGSTTTEAAEKAPAPADSSEVAAITTGDTDAGKKVFSTTCVACHGPNAEGVTGLGPNLHKNAFISGLDDDALAKFIADGRAVDAPDNKTGVAMPPSGGNPNLSADDLANIAAYLRSLQ